ncbi:MAG TPA: ComEC/Rec2 family competence protein [Thermoanaerobaculia bacterium]|nr:ComEC/Rec2 family competence protein [Thermoanaerobaculia bacterium]
MPWRDWLDLRPAAGVMAGLCFGLLLAGRLRHLPVGAVLVLLVLALSWRRAVGVVVATVSLGLLVGWVRLESPARAAPEPDWDRPVVARVRPTGSFRPAEGGWSAPAVADSVRQGSVVSLAPRRLWLFVAGPSPPQGRAFWVRGLLRPGEPPGNGASTPVGPDRLSVKSQRLLTAVSDRRPADDRASPARGSTARAERFERALAGDRGLQLAVALLLGQPWRLDDELRQSLRDWGLAHLTAASGLHVGMIAVAFGVVAAWSRRGGRWLAPAGAVVGYCLLVGERPSLLRASLMLALVWAAREAGRRPDAVNGLAAVGVALLLAEPALLGDLGFRLSFAATAGILLLSPPLRRAWGSPTWVRSALSISVSAQLATLPITVTAFSTLPLLAPLLNLFFVPWTALCLLAGGLWLGLWSLGIPVDAGWLDPLAWPFGWLGGVEAPWWAVPTWTPSLTEATLVAGGVFWLLVRPRWWSAGSGLVALWLVVYAAGSVRGAELWMLDVGQGDAFLLRSGRGAVLIDGGGWRRGDFGRRVVLPALSRLGLRRLDLVILSHPDVDHCGGLADLAERIPVGELWLGPGALESSCGRELATAFGPRVTELEGGERARVDGWSFEVGPLATGGSSNQRSVVLRAQVAGSSILFTGDLDGEGERALLRSGFELRADVLKVAHHGSRSSTTTAFLDAVSPRYALVSAGRGNAYGHPAKEVIARLQRGGATVLRSDLDGRTGLSFGPGRRIRFETERIRWSSGPEWRTPHAWRRTSPEAEP